MSGNIMECYKRAKQTSFFIAYFVGWVSDVGNVTTWF